MVRRYRIEHVTLYKYSDQVSTSFGRGYLHPREFPGQRCLTHSLTVEPKPSDMAEDNDVYGNVNSYFHVTDSHTELKVTSRSEVEVTPADHDPAVLTAPWETARPSGIRDPQVDRVHPGVPVGTDVSGDRGVRERFPSPRGGR